MPAKKKSKPAPKKKTARVAKAAVPQKITYASLALTDADHAAYDQAVEEVRAKFGTRYPLYIDGAERTSAGGEFEKRSPVNRNWIVGYFQKGTREDAQDAIRAARAAYPEWSGMGHPARIKLLRRGADLMIERRYEIAAAMAFEVGKNRGESLAEVNESAELIRYYCEQMELNKGFVKPLEAPNKNETTVSVLRPYGVWAVISPWNFPLALATGMASGALVAGNAVVFKPATDSPLSGYYLYKCLADAGLPKGAINFVTGPGSAVGVELEQNPGIDGLVFTGSKEVGMRLYKNFTKEWPRPCITEMGGKNPAIVAASADLDEAAEGVMRSAFGYDGQKCSACSRVYVDNRVKDKFVALLLDYTGKRVKVGDPSKRETFMGPVINRAAVETFQGAVNAAMHAGGKILYGGHVLTEGEYAEGYFVEPTIVDGLPKNHPAFKEEYFVPFLAIAGVDSLDEALKEANDCEYGLCAGIFSEDAAEVQKFFDHIEAGVLYANRRAGATTGAWPGVNSFGGWKGSGCTGKSGLGPYYVQQFMREQSRWVVK